MTFLAHEHHGAEQSRLLNSPLFDGMSKGACTTKNLPFTRGGRGAGALHVGSVGGGDTRGGHGGGCALCVRRPRLRYLPAAPLHRHYNCVPGDPPPPPSPRRPGTRAGVFGV